MNTLDPARDIAITLLEGANRLLSALPEKLSSRAEQLLRDRGVEVSTNVKVADSPPDHLLDAQGKRYDADLCVWAAGIKAPDFLNTLGLEVNRINQIVVDKQLRTEDPNIFAIGDCAQAPDEVEGQYLPARAQVAHQQASYLFMLLGQRLRSWHVN